MRSESAVGPNYIRGWWKFDKKISIFLMYMIVSNIFALYAEELYVAQASSGAGTGSSCANAYAITWFNNKANWGEGANLISPGDTVHLCGLISTSLIVQGGGSSTKPITIQFEHNAKLSKAAWGTETAAAMYSSNNDFIIIDGGVNGAIECTDNGTALVNQQKSEGIHIKNSDHWAIKNLYITGIYLRTADSNDSNRYGRCITANTCSNLSINDCQLEHAEYALLITAQYANTSDLDIFGCDISKCATGIVLALSAEVNYSGLKVYANKIHDLHYWDGSWGAGLWHHCDGIHTWGNFPGHTLGKLEVYNNEFYGDWGAHVTGWIYTSDYTTPVEVCNNTFTNSAEKPAHGFISLTSYNEGAVAKVYNNVMTGGGADNTGGSGVFLRLVDVDITYNIFEELYVGVNAESGDVLISSDYNGYYNVKNIGYYGGFIDLLSEWQSFLGGCPGINNDCQSKYDDFTPPPETPPRAPMQLRVIQ